MQLLINLTDEQLEALAALVIERLVEQYPDLVHRPPDEGDDGDDEAEGEVVI